MNIIIIINVYDVATVPAYGTMNKSTMLFLLQRAYIEKFRVTYSCLTSGNPGVESARSAS